MLVTSGIIHTLDCTSDLTGAWEVPILSLEGLWPQRHISLPVLSFSVGAGVAGAEVGTRGDVPTLVTLGASRNQQESED